MKLTLSRALLGNCLLSNIMACRYNDERTHDVLLVSMRSNLCSAPMSLPYLRATKSGACFLSITLDAGPHDWLSQYCPMQV